MSNGVTDFSVLTRRSVAGKVAEAIVELLLANAQIVAFLGATGVVRTNGLTIDLPIPWAMVYPVSERRVLNLNREAEVELQTVIGLCYDQTAIEMAAGDKSYEEFFNLCCEILVANQRLEGTTAGGVGALVDGIDSFDPVDLVIQRGDDSSATIFRSFVVNHRYRIDAQTGQRT